MIIITTKIQSNMLSKSLFNQVKTMLFIQCRQLTSVVSANVEDKYVMIETTKANMPSPFLVKNEMLKYPFVWLRDNCQCTKCFHKESSSRVLDYRTFDVDLKPVTVEVCAEHGAII